jgi:hypothetical protein
MAITRQRVQGVLYILTVLGQASEAKYLQL